MFDPTQPTIVREVQIRADGVNLPGDLSVPTGARGVVLFAHGSGSSRFSRRNRSVAAELQRAGMATLLIDLLTPDEDRAEARGAMRRFDIGMLAARLVGAIDWLAGDEATGRLLVGLFGASTGGGAAIVAAAERPERVAAVVSRGGRPDLAGEDLARVAAPTMLIVGGADEPVIGLNRAAMAKMRHTVKLEIVPDATHLFEEPGTLERVAELAAAWFRTHLPAAG